MGATSDAHTWASKALELQGGHADALALMSQLHMERRCGLEGDLFGWMMIGSQGWDEDRHNDALVLFRTLPPQGLQERP